MSSGITHKHSLQSTIQITVLASITVDKLPSPTVVVMSDIKRNTTMRIWYNICTPTLGGNSKHCMNTQIVVN